MTPPHLLNNSGAADMFKNEHWRLAKMQELKNFVERNKISLQELMEYRNEMACLDYINNKGW